MEQIEVQLRDTIKQVLKSLYSIDADEKQIQLSATRKEFEGDITLVVFPFVRFSKKSPDDTAIEIGSMLLDKGLINSFNVVKGFLNMLLGEAKLIDQFNKLSENELYGLTTATEQSPLVMIEYSSPNTNKPLHLGHIRNNLLGFSLAKIMEANGNRVVKTNIVNDRGIHICKSMLAWKKWGNGETPDSTGMKGDHLIGKYYVIFDKEYKKELALLEAKGLSKEEA